MASLAHMHPESNQPDFVGCYEPSLGFRRNVLLDLPSLTLYSCNMERVSIESITRSLKACADSTSVLSTPVFSAIKLAKS